jgi:molecular chaperone GrpE
MTHAPDGGSRRSHPGDDHETDRHDDREATSSTPAGESDAAAQTTVGAGPFEDRLRAAEDRYLRAQAELDNYRKRSQREFADAQRFREIDLLRDLLPVLDNVHRAIEAADKTADIESLRSGFRMTAQQLEKLLAAHGCEAIATDGEAFDPAVHDAILQQPAAGAAPGTVLGTALRGYRLHDRVVRPAQVIVAQGAS